jgi:hypothetical protein
MAAPVAPEDTSHWPLACAAKRCGGVITTPWGAGSIVIPASANQPLRTPMIAWV